MQPVRTSHKTRASKGQISGVSSHACAGGVGPNHAISNIKVTLTLA